MSASPVSWLLWLEVALYLTGLWLLYVHALAPAARAQVPALGPWSVDLFTFGLWAFAVIAGLLVAQTISVAILGLPDPTANPWRFVVVGGSIHCGALVAIGLLRLFVGRRLSGVASRPWHGNTLVAALVTLLIAIPIVSTLARGWEYVLQHLKVEAPRQVLIDVLRDSHEPGARLVFALFAVVIAPMAEELVFRAGLFRYLRTRVPRRLALVLPAALFALMHGYVVTLVPLTLLGIIFSLAYERTGRIAVPILAHAGYNLLTVVLVLGGAVPA